MDLMGLRYTHSGMATSVIANGFAVWLVAGVGPHAVVIAAAVAIRAKRIELSYCRHINAQSGALCRLLRQSGNRIMRGSLLDIGNTDEAGSARVRR